MTTESGLDLFPHQAEFRREFGSPEAPSRQLLIAPPGLGKGYVAQALARDVASLGGGARVLILTPAALVSQYEASLRPSGQEYTVLRVDRHRLREILSARGDGDLWPDSAVVVMSTDFAKQDDVASLLAKTMWDLLLVDEADALGGQRERLVRGLSISARRLLLLGTTEEAAQLVEVVPDLAVVRWDRDVADSRGQRIFVAKPRAYHVAEYMRSDDEAAFAKHLLDFVEEETLPSDVPQSRLVRSVITRELVSSPHAIEQTLLRLRERLAVESEFRVWSGLDQPRDPEMPGLDYVGSAIWRDREAAAARAEDLVSRLEALSRDSKAQRFQELVGELTGSPSVRICVFSAFAATLEYLAEFVEEMHETVRLLAGRMPVAARQSVIAEFMSEGGVLLLTDGVTQGLNLAVAHNFINYDLPESRSRMEQRWGRFDRVGQKETVHSYAFRDTCAAVGLEEQLLRDHGFMK